MDGDGYNIVLKNCKLKIADNPDALLDKISQIVKCINMVRLGQPIYKKGNDKLPGVSAIQMIETSHIAIHGFSNTNSYIVTVISCKKFDIPKLNKLLIKEFQPKSYALNFFPIDL